MVDEYFIGFSGLFFAEIGDLLADIYDAFFSGITGKIVLSVFVFTLVCIFIIRPMMSAKSDSVIKRDKEDL